MEIIFSDKHTLYVVEQDYSTVFDWAWQRQLESSQDTAIRFIRGRKARTLSSCFDEFAASIQFPYYFGENWNAFKDCITDLGWINCGSLVIVVFDADQLLINEPSKEFEVLVRILQNAREDRNQKFQNIDNIQKDIL